MKISFLNGLRKGEQVKLSDKEISLGREVDNDVIIVTDGVSRYHAKILKQSDGKWLLKDLGSTNGCKVNKKLIEGEALFDEGDVIAIGDQNFSVDAGEAKTPITEVKEPVKESKKNSTRTVKKIVFEPMPKKTEKKKTAPKPIVEAVKPKAKPDPELTAKELSTNADNIFGEQNSTSKADKKKSAPVARKHIFNILFYIMLLLGVVVFVLFFLKSNQEVKKTNVVSTTQTKKIPLVLYYVKNKISNDNVFRFSLLIENNIAEFTIDDLKSDRHHNETIKEIKPEFMNALQATIEGTGFMDLSQISAGSAVNNLDETRTMTIALDNKFNSISIKNNSAPTSFEDIEVAIEVFADGYDLLTFAMPPKELQKRAKESFAKAEQYYANRYAKAGNLLAAKRRYKITIDYLNQFSPKPKIWDIARKRYAEVEDIRYKRYDTLRYELERLERLTKLKEAIDVLNEMKELTNPDDSLYKTLNMKISILSQRLNARKK